MPPERRVADRSPSGRLRNSPGDICLFGARVKREWMRVTALRRARMRCPGDFATSDLMSTSQNPTSTVHQASAPNHQFSSARGWSTSWRRNSQKKRNARVPKRNGGSQRPSMLLQAPRSSRNLFAYVPPPNHATRTWPSFSGEKRSISPSTSSDDRPCGPGSPPVRSGFSQRAEMETFPAGLPVASSIVTHSATTGRPSASGDRSTRASPIKPCSRGYRGREDALNACVIRL